MDPHLSKSHTTQISLTLSLSHTNTHTLLGRSDIHVLAHWLSAHTLMNLWRNQSNDMFEERFSVGFPLERVFTSALLDLVGLWGAQNSPSALCAKVCDNPKRKSQQASVLRKELLQLKSGIRAEKMRLCFCGYETKLHFSWCWTALPTVNMVFSKTWATAWLL